MKAILVDDERLALNLLRKLLESLDDGIEIIGAYSKPYEAIEETIRLQPDVVFLDIQMPGISGLQVGEQILEAVPDVEIVFVTAYDHYAVEAFDLCAFDYLMKPVQRKRLAQTVGRLRGKIRGSEQAGSRGEIGSGLPILICFDNIQVQLPGGQAQPMKWRTAKAQELFAYMLHFRGKVVDKDTILELLWPDFDVPRASQQLYTTIYLIRQTLKKYGLHTISISSQGIENGYMLTVGETLIDTEVWEERMKRLGPPDLRTAAEHRSVMDMYRGDYFKRYDFLWAESERERLRRLWLNYALDLSCFYEEHGMAEDAIAMNLLIQQRYPFDEESYFTLMKLYDSVGDRAAVKDQYKLLAEVLGEELGSTINKQIKEWYERWCHGLA